MLFRSATSRCTPLQVDVTTQSAKHLITNSDPLKSLECFSAPDITVSEATGSFAGTEGEHNCTRDRGARFPSCTETAVEIARAVNPQRLSAVLINSAVPPSGYYFCSIAPLVFSLADALPHANRTAPPPPSLLATKRTSGEEGRPHRPPSSTASTPSR